MTKLPLSDKGIPMAYSNGSPAIGHLSLIVEGIVSARNQGWISDEEAKVEVRAMLPQTKAKDERAKRAKSLRKKADELETGEDNEE